MTTTLGEMTVEEAASMAAGNCKTFSCFAWDRAHNLDEPDQWAIIYTSNRDSGLLAMSNANAIRKALERFTEGDDPDVVFESHGHWAVGHVDGFSIRVFRHGGITDAFKAYHELTERLAEYPILDETEYGQLEYDATLENIADSAWRLKAEYKLPDAWESYVYNWLSDHRQGAVENRDDRGSYPEENDLRAAFKALSYEPVE